MKLLLVAEGKHEFGGALETFVRRLSGVQCEFDVVKVSDPKLRAHPGKGGRYFKKAIRCLIVAAERGCDGMVLLIDQDDQPDRRKQLSEAQGHTSLIALPRAMGVAVVTFDAWMLADEQALTTVLSTPVQRQSDPETIKNPKDVCEALRDEAGSSLDLTDLYSSVAGQIDLEALSRRCPDGFAPFAQKIKEMGGYLSAAACRE